MLTMLLLNDIEVWLTYVNPEAVKRWWRGKDAFAMDDSEIIGYWESEPFAKTADESVKITIFRKIYEDKIMIAAGNVSPADKKARVEVSLDRFGLEAPRAKATDAVTGAEIPLTGNALEFEIRRYNYRMIIIE